MGRVNRPVFKSIKIYQMATLTKAKCAEKNASLLKTNDKIYCTEDGTAFYGTQEGFNYANSHANSSKPALKIFEIYADGKEAADDNPHSLAKLKKMNVEQLEDLAATNEPVIDLSECTNKASKVEVIDAALNGDD